MNRKYHEGGWILRLLGLALFLLVMFWAVWGIRDASETSERESLRIARQAVVQAAASCYSLNGAYPATFEELKKQSGISIDEEQYVVFYEIFASNIMPDITVLKREP